jgi:hypothetical protein
LSDSENVDPADFLESSSKRKKVESVHDLCKPSAFTLKTFSKPKSRIQSSSVLTARPETPIINTTIKPTIVSSAPAAACRSPTLSKRSGILSSRRTRLNAPAFGSRSRAPLSLAAAVNGTLANKKHKRRSDAATLEDSKPRSWFFDIYEETDAQQEDVVNDWTMTQSARTLDISDDESKTATREERGKGKENIPPNELGTAAPAAPITVVSVQPATSRKDMMTEEPRTPLGDLNPSEYYAEGLDATSVVLVAEDMPEPEEQVAAEVLKTQTQSVDFNFNAELVASDAENQHNLMQHSELTNLISSASSTLRFAPTEHHNIEASSGLFDQYPDRSDDVENDENVEPTYQDIEIWESGSAKDEAGEIDSGECGIFAEL